MYCQQTDLENRISAQKLADLCNETVGSTSATASIVTSLINKSDALINSKAGQVYTTPLYSALTGTIASSTTTLTGTNTLFTTELSLGLPLLNLATGEVRVVDSITSNTVATTATAFTTLAGATLQAFDRIIFDLSVDLACYYAMQRRFSILAMPDDWKATYKTAMDSLQGIADMDVGLSYATLVSAEATMVTQTSNPQIDFYDENNPVSFFS